MCKTRTVGRRNMWGVKIYIYIYIVTPDDCKRGLGGYHMCPL